MTNNETNFNRFEATAESLRAATDRYKFVLETPGRAANETETELGLIDALSDALDEVHFATGRLDGLTIGKGLGITSTAVVVAQADLSATRTRVDYLVESLRVVRNCDLG